MCTILEMARRWQAVRQSGEATIGAIELTAIPLADVNRQQLLAGRNAEGLEVRPQYSFRGGENSYASLKNQMNPVPGFGTPDLKYTGTFHASIKVNASTGKLNWEASDPNSLLSRYGPVLGVYENTPLQVYRETILFPLSIKIIKAATGAK